MNKPTGTKGQHTPLTNEAMDRCGELPTVEHMYGYMVSHAMSMEERLQDALVLIDSWIPRGQLDGDGLDKSAQRNGMVMAYNLVYALQHGQSVEMGPHRDEPSPTATKHSEE